MLQRRLDAIQVIADRPRQSHKRGEPAPRGPLLPAVETFERLLERQMKHTTQTLLEQVGAVQRLVRLRQPAQRPRLLRVQVFRVLPQRPARVLQLLGVLARPRRTQLVPLLAPDFVECFGRPLHDMERVEAARRLRCPLPHHVFDPLRGIGAHQLQLGAALGTELIEELAQRLLVTPGGHPHQPARVVVEHHRHVFVPLAVAQLVNADAPQAAEEVGVLARILADALDDPPDRLPRNPHQLAHRGLVRVHGQPGALVLEVQREPAAGPRPGHVLHHHTVLLALHPRHLGFQVRLHRAEIQRTPLPPARAVVVPPASPMADRASAPVAFLCPHVRHECTRSLVELPLLHNNPLDSEKALPYAVDGRHDPSALGWS